ncbi:MAG: HypC/HybG/HupF family hydrogenase formation chaperone [Desulfohalobiaceae bacterium]|nr:HypC/HybG/HupF family hydrogenase formation chaperone [Desulfohalobiaceae bacterium]
MCLAVPAEIVSMENDMAICRVGGGETTVQASLLLLDEEAAVGDYLLIHAGFALRRLDPGEAEETLRLMREMADQEQSYLEW